MIRKAIIDDIPSINDLLFQVHDVHANLFPDIFIKGKKKYNDSELEKIINDDNRPIFVYLIDGKLVGYCFCIFDEVRNSLSRYDKKYLYIDDLCVDSNYRKKGIGKELFEYVYQYGVSNGFDSITLNVWNGNSAMKFYEDLGFKPLKMTMEKKIK